MNWKPLAAEFRRSFVPDPALEAELPDGEILIPSEEYTFRGALVSVMENAGIPVSEISLFRSDPEHGGHGSESRLFDDLLEDPEVPTDGVFDLLWDFEHGDDQAVSRQLHNELCTRVLELCWDSGGPMSACRDLLIWELPGSYHFVSYYKEYWACRPEEPHAAIRKDADEESWYVLLRSFWLDYVSGGDGIFQSLPDLTTNRRPDLLPEWVIKQFYWEWMQFQEDELWVMMRDRMVRAAKWGPVEPLQLPEELKGVAEEELPEAIDAFLARRRSRIREEARTLTDEDRKRIFENYFSATYRQC